MKNHSVFFGLVGAAFALGIAASPAQAQFNVTYVSGTGDNANPCLRTSPCKTFAGALPKTVAGGEIHILDPGDYAAFTITKAISIYSEGVVASVTITGTNGITITAGASDVVNLRGLTIASNGTSPSGIQVNSAGQVNIQDCIIKNFGTTAPNAGISVVPSSGTVMVKVQNSTIINNLVGINAKPSGGAIVNLGVDRSRIDGNNGGGIRADGTGGGSVNALVSNSSMSLNTNNGAAAVSGSSGNIVMTLTADVMAQNGAAGVASNNSNGGSAAVFVDTSTLSNNAVGTTFVGNSTLISYGGNKIVGPWGDGFSFTLDQQ